MRAFRHALVRLGLFLQRLPEPARSDLRDPSTVTHGLGRAAPGVWGSARGGRRGLETPSAQVLSYFRAAHSPLRLGVPHTGGTLLGPARCTDLLMVTPGLGRAAPGVWGSARGGRRGLETPSAQVLSYFRAAHSPLRLGVPHTGGTLLGPARCTDLLMVTPGLGRAAPGVWGSARGGRRGLETPSAQVLSYFRAAHSPLRLGVPHTGRTYLPAGPA